MAEQIYEVRTVDINTLRPRQADNLRGIDPENEEYQQLLSVIKQYGMMGSIIGHDCVDAATKEKFVEIIDGHQRWDICKKLGYKTMNVEIRPPGMTEDNITLAQMVLNGVRVTTKPAEYAAGLRRYIDNNPLESPATIAARIGKSAQYVSGLLKLNRIKDENVRQLIDNGQIPASKAVALAQLPEDEHAAWVEKAISLPANEFNEQVALRKKELAEAHRKGDDGTKVHEYVPTPRFRTLAEVRDLLDKGTKSDVAKSLIATNKVNDPVTAFILGAQWVTNMDPATVAARKAEWEAKEAQKNDTSRAKALENAKKRMAKAEEDLKKLNATPA